MKQPLEIAQEVYERFGAGDVDGLMALCADEIEWVVNGPSSLAKSRAYRGKSGVQEFLDLVAGWEFSSFAPREFHAAGTTVVVLGEETGSDKASGTPHENRWAHVFDVRDGKVVRFREFLCHWPGGETPPAMSWGPRA